MGPCESNDSVCVEIIFLKKKMEETTGYGVNEMVSRVVYNLSTFISNLLFSDFYL